jgi:hypothetical protein
LIPAGAATAAPNSQAVREALLDDGYGAVRVTHHPLGHRTQNPTRRACQTTPTHDNQVHLAVFRVPKNLFSGMTDGDVSGQLNTDLAGLLSEAVELFGKVCLSMVKHRVDLDRDCRLGQPNDTYDKQPGFKLLGDFQA